MRQITTTIQAIQKFRIYTYSVKVKIMIIPQSCMKQYSIQRPIYLSRKNFFPDFRLHRWCRLFIFVQKEFEEGLKLPPAHFENIQYYPWFGTDITFSCTLSFP